jgi:hypothetical protein
VLRLDTAEKLKKTKLKSENLKWPSLLLLKRDVPATLLPESDLDDDNDSLDRSLDGSLSRSRSLVRSLMSLSRSRSRLRLRSPEAPDLELEPWRLLAALRSLLISRLTCSWTFTSSSSALISSCSRRISSLSIPGIPARFENVAGGEVLGEEAEEEFDELVLGRSP